MKRRLLILAPAYLPDGGGVEKHIQMVVRELVRRGWEVVIAVRWSEGRPEHAVIEDVGVWRLPKSWSPVSLGWWWLRHWWVIRGMDAVHSHDIYPRWLRRLIPGVRWVHTFHGYEGWPLDAGAIASRQGVRREVEYCFGVGAFIEKWYGTKLDEVTYGAAETAADVPARENGAEVVFVGRLAEDTGFRTYLEGFVLIHEKHPEARMTVVGDGPLRGWAETFVAERGLPVEVAGWVTDVMPYMKAARVMLVSGYLAILEAARVGKPIIAHYGTPIKEDYLRMHPLAEDLVIVSTPEEVAAGYERAMAMPEERLAAARKWAEAQTWTKLADEYERSYLRINRS